MNNTEVQFEYPKRGVVEEVEEDIKERSVCNDCGNSVCDIKLHVKIIVNHSNVKDLIWRVILNLNAHGWIMVKSVVLITSK